ncbi:hypothetical protein [Treponema vincentii]|uniref:hypothetical protein n=1 Tax=Treponema vincentii TaxID=69710 RepID=UPI00058779F9|nr:hypothetical protein [Treponema vincentii]
MKERSKAALLQLVWMLCISPCLNFRLRDAHPISLSGTVQETYALNTAAAREKLLSFFIDVRV